MYKGLRLGVVTVKGKYHLIRHRPHVYYLVRRYSSNNSISTKLSNYLHSSIDNLQTFLINNVAEPQNINMDNNKNIGGSFDLKKMNNKYIEAILLTDLKYEELPGNRQFTMKFTELDLISTLKTYINSRGKLSKKEFKNLLFVLLNEYNFQNVSIIISQLPLHFEELLHLVNELLDHHKIFFNTDFTKFLFLIHLSTQINSKTLYNLDFFSNSSDIDSNLNIFRLMKIIYFKQYKSKKELEMDFQSICHLDNTNLQLLKFMKTLDLIKMDNLWNTEQQYTNFSIELNKFIKSSEPDHKNSHIPLMMRHMIGLNEYEIEDYQHRTTDTDLRIEEFLDTRKHNVLNLVFNENNWIIEDCFDLYQILRLEPNNDDLNNKLYNSFKFLACTSKYDVLILELLLQLSEKPKNHRFYEITRRYFEKLSLERKIKTIEVSFINYFSNLNSNNRDRVGDFLSKLNKHEMSIVLTEILNELFVSSKCNFEELLIFTEIISNTNLQDNKKAKSQVFSRINQILINHLNKNYNSNEFFGVKQEELFESFYQFIYFLKPQKHVLNLVPSLVKMYSIQIKFTDADEFRNKLSELLDIAFDSICSKSTYLSDINPKNYSSKIYFNNHKLIEAISVELLKLPKHNIINLLQNRLAYLCSNEKDWIYKFHEKINILNVFIEVFIRRGLREPSSIRSDTDEYQYREMISKETLQIAHNLKVWEILETLSNCSFKETDFIYDNEGENLECGDGILFVLKKLESKVNIPKFDAEYKLIEDSLLDSTILKQDELLHCDESNNDFDDFNKLQNTQNFHEFNELYSNIETFIESNKFSVNEQNENEKILRYYDSDEKKQLIQNYGFLVFKGKLFESLITDEPKLIDKIILKLFQDYSYSIPILLLHSLSIGLIKSPKMKFTEKIDLIKLIDKLIIKVNKMNSKNNNLFKKYVNFKKFYVALIELVINESKISNSGSSKTLYWAIKKIMKNPNLNEYNSYLVKWKNEMKNMEDCKTGFWNPRSKQNWIDRE